MRKTLQLSYEEHECVYAEIEKNSFAETTLVEHLRIIITGGQPGSGKNKLLGMSKAEFPDGTTFARKVYVEYNRQFKYGQDES